MFGMHAFHFLRFKTECLLSWSDGQCSKSTYLGIRCLKALPCLDSSKALPAVPKSKSIYHFSPEAVSHLARIRTLQKIDLGSPSCLMFSALAGNVIQVEMGKVLCRLRGLFHDRYMPVRIQNRHMICICVVQQDYGRTKCS